MFNPAASDTDTINWVSINYPSLQLTERTIDARLRGFICQFKGNINVLFKIHFTNDHRMAISAMS